MEKENKIYLFIFFVLALSLFLFSFGIYLTQIAVLEKIEVVANLRIGDTLGFDADAGRLDFGTIAPNSSSRRTFTIENNYNFPIKAEFDVEGEIGEFLLFDKIIFIDVGETKEINVSTITLVEAEQGNYSGKFITTLKKSRKSI